MGYMINAEIEVEIHKYRIREWQRAAEMRRLAAEARAEQPTAPTRRHSLVGWLWQWATRPPVERRAAPKLRTTASARQVR
jgi:hypothetical protein